MSNVPPSIDSAAQEIDALRQRIADLEAALTRHQLPPTGQDILAERLESILQNLDGIVWSQDAQTFDVLYLNPTAEAIYGYPVQAFFDDHELWIRLIHPADMPQLDQFFPQIIADGSAEVDYRIIRADGQIRWLHDRGRLVCDAGGHPLRLDGLATDITDRKLAEEERTERARQEEVIRTQALLLRELSTPLIPISDQALVMPLIGTVDSLRAQQVMETLMDGIVANQATTAIIDITGVPVVDTQVANALLHAAQAVKLLGARVILSGIRPEVAQTLVALQIDLGDIVTHSTLQRSIAFALEQRHGQRTSGIRQK